MTVALRRAATRLPESAFAFHAELAAAVVTGFEGPIASTGRSRTGSQGWSVQGTRARELFGFEAKILRDGFERTDSCYRSTRPGPHRLAVNRRVVGGVAPSSA